jgi:hypothetical protein
MNGFSAWLAAHKRDRFSEMNQQESKQNSCLHAPKLSAPVLHMDKRSGTPAHGIHPGTMLGKTSRSADGIFLSFTWE